MQRVHRTASGICAMLLWCFASAASADGADGLEPGWRESVLELRVNGVLASGDVVALRDASGGLWLAEEDLARLRLRVPRVNPHPSQGRRYFPLSAIPGAQVAFDDAHSAASISAPATA